MQSPAARLKVALPSGRQPEDAVANILAAIRALMNPPASKRRGIGFTADAGGK